MGVDVISTFFGLLTILSYLLWRTFVLENKIDKLTALIKELDEKGK